MSSQAHAVLGNLETSAGVQLCMVVSQRSIARENLWWLTAVWSGSISGHEIM